MVSSVSVSVSNRTSLFLAPTKSKVYQLLLKSRSPSDRCQETNRKIERLTLVVTSSSGTHDNVVIIQDNPNCLRL